MYKYSFKTRAWNKYGTPVSCWMLVWFTSWGKQWGQCRLCRPAHVKMVHVQNTARSFSAFYSFIYSCCITWSKAPESGKTIRINQCCQTNVLAKLLKSDPEMYIDAFNMSLVVCCLCCLSQPPPHLPTVFIHYHFYASEIIHSLQNTITKKIMQTFGQNIFS